MGGADYGPLLDLACSPAAHRPNPRSVRDRALLAILWRTGLGIREVLALTGDGVLLEDDVPVELLLSNATGSTSEPRGFALDSTAQEELGRWLDVRRQVLRIQRVNLTTSPLFCTTSADQTGRALSLSQVRLTLSRLGKRAALQRRVRPRASLGTQAVAQRAAVRCLRSDLTPDGTALHEIVDRAVHQAFGILHPSEGLEGLFEIRVVLDLVEDGLLEELTADADEIAPPSAALDVWHRLSAR